MNPQYGVPASPQSNTTGLAAMIVGIAAIPLVCCFYIGLPIGIVAIVLGFIGKQKADQGVASNRSQAMTGLICGAVAVALSVLLLIIASVVDFPTNMFTR